MNIEYELNGFRRVQRQIERLDEKLERLSPDSSLTAGLVTYRISGSGTHADKTGERIAKAEKLRAQRDKLLIKANKEFDKVTSIIKLMKASDGTAENYVMMCLYIFGHGYDHFKVKTNGISKSEAHDIHVRALQELHKRINCREPEELDPEVENVIKKCYNIREK